MWSNSSVTNDNPTVEIGQLPGSDVRNDSEFGAEINVVSEFGALTFRRVLRFHPGVPDDTVHPGTKSNVSTNTGIWAFARKAKLDSNKVKNSFLILFVSFQGYAIG
jgi:hypothetical protein